MQPSGMALLWASWCILSISFTPNPWDVSTWLQMAPTSMEQSWAVSFAPFLHISGLQHLLLSLLDLYGVFALWGDSLGPPPSTAQGRHQVPHAHADAQGE